MLGKLLKYDLKSVFKLWWIGAVASLVLCLLGSACITAVNSGRQLPQIVNISAVTIIVFAVIGLIAFFILSAILVLVRFYRNLFTDEGYLTFTLPVTRGQLLFSKLLMGLITAIATTATVLFNGGIMLLIGFAKYIPEFLKGIALIIQDIAETFGIYFWIYILEGIALLILGIVFSLLFMFCCITLASIITKKARVITSIGIYYGANMIISFALQIFLLFGIEGIFTRISALELAPQLAIMAIIMVGLVFFGLAVCLMIYTLQYFMLESKLNLS